MLSREKNRKVLETAPLELAARRLRAQGRKRLSRITIDIATACRCRRYGEQPGFSAYNGHVRERIHYPLIASCAETGDLLAGLLRDGNAGPAQQAATWIPRIVQAAREHLAPEVQVRLDAGDHRRRDAGGAGCGTDPLRRAAAREPGPSVPVPRRLASTRPRRPHQPGVARG
jgi:hypothetical protein